MTRRRLKPWVKQFLVGLDIVVVILLFAAIGNSINKETEKTFERVSKECASQGYGVIVKHTKEGDKYYVCEK